MGSRRFEPYEILAVPNTIKGAEGNNETSYQKAKEIFYPAIDKADVILVYIPNNTIGEHTLRDIEYAKCQGKTIQFIGESKKKWREEAAQNTKLDSRNSEG